MLDLGGLKPFSFTQGSLPILISFPHEGSEIPKAVQSTMTDAGRTSRDTDWLLTRLYDFPELSEASKISAEFSRYLIDLNRSRNN
ncbi:MAG: N-formylglutamate amidohydrolase, partial [Planctomycetota bacterium]